MSDLSSPDELSRRLQDHAAEVERRAEKDSSFDKYEVLGMHADVRPYLENWGAYNTEQRVAIAEAVNYLADVHDPFNDSGADGYDDDRALLAELPGRIQELGNP